MTEGSYPRALLSAIALSFFFLPTTNCVADEYPFVGKWNCEVATFTFTNRTYHNGSQTMRFEAIHFGKGNDFRLDFKGGYKTSLFDVTKKTMTWHSLASGDTFKCSRLK